jgi:hypothetical protein
MAESLTLEYKTGNPMALYPTELARYGLELENDLYLKVNGQR